MSTADRDLVLIAFDRFRDAALADRAEPASDWLEFWDPGVVYYEDPKWPGAGVHHGAEAVIAAFAGYLEVVLATTYDVEGVTEVAGGFIVTVRIAGITRETRVPYDHRWAYLVRVRDGRVSEFRAFYDPEEAILAAESASSAPRES